MKKSWQYRLLSGLSALMIAGAGPMAALADESASASRVIQTGKSSLEGPGKEKEASKETLEETAAEEEETEVEETEAEILPATEEEIDAYFDGSVFVGDSVMLGFRNYAMLRSATFLGRMQFLASGSFSVHNALWPINSKSVHPIFQGQQRFVWESLGALQAKKVFLFFGLNDMNMGSLADTCACYSQVIANIKTVLPDAEIHVISMTYTLRGKGKGNLQNNNIRAFNELLKQMALENGWGFVDLAPHLADGNGDLAPVYCSDNYVHQTNAAYDVWTVVLREYARSQLEQTTDFPVNGKKAQEDALSTEESREEAASAAEESQEEKSQEKESQNSKEKN